MRPQAEGLWSPQKLGEAGGLLPCTPRRELALLTPSFWTSGLQSPRDCLAALLPSSWQVAMAAPGPRFRDHAQMLVLAPALTGS